MVGTLVFRNASSLRRYRATAGSTHGWCGRDVGPYSWSELVRMVEDRVPEQCRIAMMWVARCAWCNSGPSCRVFRYQVGRHTTVRLCARAFEAADHAGGIQPCGLSHSLTKAPCLILLLKYILYVTGLRWVGVLEDHLLFSF
jgi:hypothetical protein